MKFLLLFLFLSLCHAPVHSQDKADAVLERVSKKLDGLKSIKYHTTRELNYSSENYRAVSTWNVYCDFQSTDKIIGFKYQFEDSLSTQIFNGTESFRLDKKTHTMQVNDHPDRESFSSLSALYNSLVTFKNILPLLLKDKTATRTMGDTTINNTTYTLITIYTGKRRIQNLGTALDSMSTKSNFIYKLLLQKNNEIPVEIVQGNDVNTDFIKTSFARVESNTGGPSESSWFYSTYSHEYKRSTEKAEPLLLSKGLAAPGWKLQVFNKEESLSLDDLKGKVILLDFWIKNCSPCIQSVPHLNDLQSKFKPGEFAVISINSYDRVEDVSWFCNKYKIKYPVLLNGKTIADEYGVSGFPAFFIIDKEGRIIYSGSGYDGSMQDEMESVIKKAL